INILGVIVFCILLGLAVGRMGKRGRRFVEFFNALNKAVMKIVQIMLCSATLPLTLQCAEQNNGIDRRVTRFILPIGATVNKNGSAFFNTVAAIFIAQMNNYPLDAGQITIIGIMAIATSIAGAALPSAAMVTTIITLTAVGLPINDIPLLIIVEWLLDRCRTVVNVMGDAFGAGILENTNVAGFLQHIFFWPICKKKKLFGPYGDRTPELTGRNITA
uniref:Amino acid transporter n=1 Tax=Electrophorus electricus TaxID=8005 RepID=A0A4W4HP73_ELEEL